MYSQTLLAAFRFCYIGETTSFVMVQERQVCITFCSSHLTCLADGTYAGESALSGLRASSLQMYEKFTIICEYEPFLEGCRDVHSSITMPQLRCSKVLSTFRYRQHCSIAPISFSALAVNSALDVVDIPSMSRYR